MVRLSLALFLVQAGFFGFAASIPLALAQAGRSDAEIGFVVGVAALVQIAAALAGGALTDRLGAVRVFIVGALCYLAACTLLFVAGVGPQAVTALVIVRLLQGTGAGLIVPAALSAAPGLVAPERRGIAIAATGSSHNLTLVLLPPMSIVVLDEYGLGGVCVFVAALVALGLVLVVARPLRFRFGVDATLDAARRRFGFAYRLSWFGPLAVMLLYVLHWGVLTAYLPQRAAAAGADIGLFFAADGLFILLARIPAGWLSDRIRPAVPIVVGIVMTAVAVVLLFAPPTTPLLVLAGALTGAGAALIIQPLMLALTNRSTDADRGSAFALFNAVFAVGIAIGSIGTAPLVESVGFAALLSGAFVGLVASAAFVIGDRGLRSRPGRMRERAFEYAAESGGIVGP